LDSLATHIITQPVKGCLRRAKPLFLISSPSPFEGEGDTGGEVVKEPYSF